MFARPALLTRSCGALTRPRRTAACCLAALALLMGAEARAQVLPKTQPDLDGATVLARGPTVTDWQPRGRRRSARRS